MKRRVYYNFIIASKTEVRSVASAGVRPSDPPGGSGSLRRLSGCDHHRRGRGTRGIGRICQLRGSNTNPEGRRCLYKSSSVKKKTKYQCLHDKFVQRNHMSTTLWGIKVSYRDNNVLEIGSYDVNY